MPRATAHPASRYHVQEQPATAEALAALPGVHELAARASDPNCFYEPWFLGPSLRHLRGNEDVRLVSVHDGDTGAPTIGYAPFHIHRHYGRIPCAHVTNWAHFNCFYAAPIIAPGYETAFWTAVIDHFDRSRWARHFISLTRMAQDGPAHRGLHAAAALVNRPCTPVFRYDRAMLASDLSADAYLEQAVRGKKRKELRRLAARLADHGEIVYRQWAPDQDIAAWAAEFLALERAGWKGADGAALDNAAPTRAFFTDIMAGAAAAGRLDFQRIDLAGKAIAMLINFIAPPGSYSFKIAFDEDYARFSPGVMIELDNLRRVLNGRALEWMDSCAVADHSMINRLWQERRTIVQLTVPLGGWRRRGVHAFARTAENSSSLMKQWLSRRTKHDV